MPKGFSSHKRRLQSTIKLVVLTIHPLFRFYLLLSSSLRSGFAFGGERVGGARIEFGDPEAFQERVQSTRAIARAQRPQALGRPPFLRL